MIKSLDKAVWYSLHLVMLLQLMYRLAHLKNIFVLSKMIYIGSKHPEIACFDFENKSTDSGVSIFRSWIATSSPWTARSRSIPTSSAPLKTNQLMRIKPAKTCVRSILTPHPTCNDPPTRPSLLTRLPPTTHLPVTVHQTPQKLRPQPL